jgi:protein required for attachment to host cells
MPVNMDPSKKRRRERPATQPSSEQSPSPDSAAAPPHQFGEETDADREKAMADAEWKNLWDATEVIDMDKV